MEFEGSCSKHNKVSFTHVATFFIAYELINSLNFFNNLDAYFTLKDCLFGAAKLTEIDNFCVLDMVLDLINIHFFHCQIVNLVKNVIFGADSSLPAHIDKKIYLSTRIRSNRWIRLY